MEEDLESRNHVSIDKLIKAPSGNVSPNRSNKVGITDEAEVKKEK